LMRTLKNSPRRKLASVAGSGLSAMVCGLNGPAGGAAAAANDPTAPAH
jgi:hypothetical protein